jgi:pimeloyl-ACP methyl ester carboxylesterase
MPKETLVFLPGMMCDERLFAPQAAFLQDRFDIRFVVARHERSIAAMAESVLAAVDSPVFSLCGLSMGGIVAMAVQRAAPERVCRLALLNTTCTADDPQRRPVRNRQIHAVREGHLARVIVEEMKGHYLARVSQADQALKALILDMALVLGPETFISQSVALRDRVSFCDGLRQCNAPTLVLCGAEDRLCPVLRHEQMVALIDHAKLQIVPGAGHLSSLEQPEAVSEALAQWLA